MFLLVLTWLVAAFGKKTREDWKKVIVSYDNMCHLKVSKKLLPLPGDLAYIWHNVTRYYIYGTTKTKDASSTTLTLA